MAAGYECMAEGEPHQANWLLSSLDPYAMFTSCSQDFPLMIIPVLAANLETDPDRLYDAIRKHLEAEGRRAAKAAKAAEANAADPAAVHAAQQEAIAGGALDPEVPEPNMYDADHPAAPAGKQ